MSAILFVITAVQVVSAVAAAFITLRPGFSDRVESRAFHVATATAVLAGITHLMFGDVFYGALLIALAVLLLSTLGRWGRTRQGEKSKK
ncbi:hypothetical protein AB0B04_18945 [Streptomyces xinghaiensis]|uniref:Uncharacterized protein n=2 Tax=Streptomyces TaxID=1883 RepID=A0A3R7EMY6_9ACTN|nr:MULTISPECIES: hypothetical protein [Streptomyces]KNE83285.1 hypothetical protein ADZ36_05430 [Streptomyces fradiae]OFA36643.1 hypothetical protein BEN35_29750 [Streptomyces fradiae]PQM20640.1 hypothetical protein Sfr7A_25995 [Streptomyces xinghaiensis]RKM92581.1 hypothetical protein SFRA_024650 [Streptomyces xinghaiensis]RNC70549.1 hypothetical protein DC095_025640 [Streptomyces xinghaiensis]